MDQSRIRRRCPGRDVTAVRTVTRAKERFDAHLAQHVHEKPSINITPLVDLMFNLIIFFLVSAQFP